MKKFAMKLFIGFMNFIYLMIKLFPIKKKVTFISRQADDPSIDLRMLQDALENEGIKTVMLTRKLEKAPGKMIGYFFHMFSQMYQLATSKVVILDSYCIMASVLKHKDGVTIVQIWHALSAIKKFGYQTIGMPGGTSELVAKTMRMHKNYSFVTCASRETAKYFCSAFAVEKEKIVYLGLPRIDYILESKPYVKEELEQRYGLSHVKRNIVYVPTFRKNKGLEMESLVDSVDSQRYNLIVRLHPLDDITIHYGEDAGVIYDNSVNTYDLLEIADVIISDYSSFVVEASLVNRPMYLYLYDQEEYNEDTGLNVDYQNEAMGKYVFREAGELAGLLEQDYDYDALSQFCAKYVDIEKTDCTGQMVNFINQLLKGNNK